MRIQNETGMAAQEQPSPLARAVDESADDAFIENAAALNWLLPWALAITGILITLILMR